VLHGLVEQDEVHTGNLIVVLLELGFKDTLKVVHSLDWKVRSFVAFACSHIGGVEKWLSVHILWFEIWELLESIGHEVSIRFMILLSDESILPNSVAFVNPESDDSKRVALVVIWLSKHQILNNLREISQVELVMELECSWHELSRVCNCQEYSHCSINELE